MITLLPKCLRFYVLDDEHQPHRVTTYEDWFNGRNHVKVSRDTIGVVDISTVFLGMDHSYGDRGPAVLFETMIFGGAHDGWQRRCSTWDEATILHKHALALVKGTVTVGG